MVKLAARLDFPVPAVPVTSIDTVGAGVQETVLLVSGSSARMAGGLPCWVFLSLMSC